jgi:hypothetical protein
MSRMSAPPEGFVGDNPELEGHVLFSADSDARSPAERFLPETVVRRCSRCASSLSVAERMFYFIEARGSLPLCRNCAEEAEATAPVPAVSFLAPERVTKNPTPFTSGGVLLEMQEPGSSSGRSRTEEEATDYPRGIAQQPEEYSSPRPTIHFLRAEGWPSEGRNRDPDARIRDIETGRRSGASVPGLRRVRQTELY